MFSFIDFNTLYEVFPRLAFQVLKREEFIARKQAAEASRLSKRSQQKYENLMHNIPKWADTFKKSCSICCKVFKVCVTIFRCNELKGLKVHAKYF